MKTVRKYKFRIVGFYIKTAEFGFRRFFLSRKNVKKRILISILKVLLINSFTGKIVAGDENSNMIVKKKISKIRIKNLNNRNIEKFQVNININEDRKSGILTKEDIENFTKINRETIKKLENEEKIAEEGKKKAEEDVKKEAEKKAQEEKAKKEQEETPSIVKGLDAIKTFLLPKMVFFNSIKGGFSIPSTNGISAKEVPIGQNQGGVDLFSGDIYSGIMPFVGVSAGFDGERLYRYELELSYFLIAGKGKNILNAPGYGSVNFDLGDNILNFSVLNLNFNGFLKIGLPDALSFGIFKGSEIFAGLGIGVGYAIPKSNFLQSALILPTFQAMAGITIPINNRFKANIYWRMIYMDFKFENQLAFKDLNGNLVNNRPINAGSLSINNFVNHFLCFDIMWNYS